MYSKHDYGKKNSNDTYELILKNEIKIMTENIWGTKYKNSLKSMNSTRCLK
jgi:hypothetical protein